MTGLHIVTQHQGQAVRLLLFGEVDMGCCAGLANAQQRAILARGCTEIVVDLDHVTLIDATGLGVLADGYRRAVAGGRQFHLVNPHGIVARVIALAGPRLPVGVRAML